MLAALAKFRPFGRPHAAGRPVRLAYSKENRTKARLSNSLQPVRRAVLVCRWQVLQGGGLECRWVTAPMDETAAERPEGKLLGFALRVGRLPHRPRSCSCAHLPAALGKLTELK
jgi:hypothetical protein